MLISLVAASSSSLSRASSTSSRSSLVSDLQRDSAVLVVDRNRCTVLNRSGDVVDRDVVAEVEAGRAIALLDRCPGEADTNGVRQSDQQVLGQAGVLRTMGLIGQDDDVGALREHRHFLALGRREFLNRGVDDASRRDLK